MTASHMAKLIFRATRLSVSSCILRSSENLDGCANASGGSRTVPTRHLGSGPAPYSQNSAPLSAPSR